MNDNNHNYFNDTIDIKNIVNDNLDNIVTIYFKSSNDKLLNNNRYKITDITMCNINHLKDKLIDFGFEKIPDNLTEKDIKEIYQFSESKIEKNIDYGQMYPCSVNIADTGDLKVILLMYNGNNDMVNLEKLPFKLKDAKDKVIIHGEVNLNKTISPKKIGIFYLNINKEDQIEKYMDLTTWNIAFTR